MKTTLSKSFALIMIFIGALLTSCNSQELASNNKRNVKPPLLVVGDYNEDEFCEMAGAIHNEIVDNVITKLDNDGYRVLEYPDDDSYAIIKDYVFEYVKQADKGVYPWSDISDEELEQIVKSINGDISFDLYVETYNKFSEETRLILDQVDDVFLYDDSNIVAELMDLYLQCDNIENEDERIITKCAISVGISSYTYWSNSGIEPLYLASDYTLLEYYSGSELFIDSPCSISWGRIAKSDLKGAIGGGVGGLIRRYILASLLGGPASWSMILGEIALEAARESVEALIDELTDNTLMVVNPLDPRLEECDNLYHVYLKSKYMSNPDMFNYYLNGRFVNLTNYLMY